MKIKKRKVLLAGSKSEVYYTYYLELEGKEQDSLEFIREVLKKKLVEMGEYEENQPLFLRGWCEIYGKIYYAEYDPKYTEDRIEFRRRRFR